MTVLRPSSASVLSAELRPYATRRERIPGVDLSALNRVLEYTPEDMTVLAAAGMRLSELQTHLGRHQQWLPLDPPGDPTIHDLLAGDRSGPRRYGYGTVRDYVIGLAAVLADGRLIHGGGRVVKNVAGYDLPKLFIGSHAELGIIVEVNFKVRPVPGSEHFRQRSCDSLEAARALTDKVLESALTPAVLDWHNLSSGELSGAGCHVIVGFAGTAAEVDWQCAVAAELGFHQPATLDYDKCFAPGHQAVPVTKLSVLPSETAPVLARLGQGEFVARAGNGIIYWRGPTEKVPSLPSEPSPLATRLKQEFDPHGMLPPLPGTTNP
jgi:glycolate oxidase FAD binding subunit